MPQFVWFGHYIGETGLLVLPRELLEMGSLTGEVCRQEMGHMKSRGAEVIV